MLIDMCSFGSCASVCFVSVLSLINLAVVHMHVHSALCIESVCPHADCPHAARSHCISRVPVCISKMRRLSRQRDGDTSDHDHDSEDPDLDLLPVEDNHPTGSPGFDDVQSHEPPAGPKNLEEMQDWPEDFLGRWLASGRCVPSCLAKCRWFVTCKWAGVGTPIVALWMFRRGLLSLTDIDMNVILYSCTDNDATCRDLLGSFEPQYLLMDLYSYFPDRLATRVLRKQQETMQQYVNSGFKGKEAKTYKEQCVEQYKLYIEMTVEEPVFKDDWPS